MLRWIAIQPDVLDIDRVHDIMSHNLDRPALKGEPGRKKSKTFVGHCVADGGFLF